MVCYFHYSISKALFHPLNHVCRVDEPLKRLAFDLNAVAVHHHPVRRRQLRGKAAQLALAYAEVLGRFLDGERVLLPYGYVLRAHAPTSLRLEPQHRGEQLSLKLRLSQGIDPVRERLISNQKDITLYAVRIPKRFTPLMELQYELKEAQRMDGVQLAFALIIELWKLITGNNIDKSSPKPLSPSIRREVQRLDQTMKEYWLLCENQIDSAQELVSFIEKKSADISALESKRQKIYNRIRRPKSEEGKEQDKAAAREISARLKPLREKLKTARAITEHYPHIVELLETERAMEAQVKTKERKYER